MGEARHILCVCVCVGVWVGTCAPSHSGSLSGCPVTGDAQVPRGKKGRSGTRYVSFSSWLAPASVSPLSESLSFPGKGGSSS